MITKEENQNDELNLLVAEFTNRVIQNLQKNVLNEIKPMEKDERIMSAHEVCSHFKISQTTLERRVRAGLKYSQAVKKGNRLFKLSDCEKFFNLN